VTVQWRTPTEQTSGQGGATVSPEATTAGAPLRQGNATASQETAKGGAIGSQAEGQRPQEGSQGRKAGVDASGGARMGERRGGSKAAVEEAARKGMAGSAVGRGPNEALQRIAALWRR
jgi:hypothetical protein